jgi:hypothetical protein
MRGLTVEQLSSQGIQSLRYREARRARFQRLAHDVDHGDGGHLVVRCGEVFVGGVTVVPCSEIDAEADVAELWSGSMPRPAIRLSRLWTDGSRAVMTLLMRAVLEHLAHAPKDSLLFGINSLSLDFARRWRHAWASVPDSDGLRARVPLEACSWPAQAQPSSDGERVVLGYLRMGAWSLAPPAGDVQNQSVKVLIGMNVETLRRRLPVRPQ